FEPLVESFAVLQKRCARDSKWRAHQVALGAFDATLPINVFYDTDLTSLLLPTEQSANAESAWRVMRTEVVELRRLERFLDECTAGIDSPSIFLKTDTQGYDLEVIQGTGARIAQIAALLIELPIKPLYRGMTLFTDAIPHLNGLGFEITAIAPVSRDA